MSVAGGRSNGAIDQRPLCTGRTFDQPHINYIKYTAVTAQTPGLFRDPFRILDAPCAFHPALHRALQTLHMLIHYYALQAPPLHQCRRQAQVLRNAAMTSFPTGCRLCQVPGARVPITSRVTAVRRGHQGRRYCGNCRCLHHRFCSRK